METTPPWRQYFRGASPKSGERAAAGGHAEVDGPQERNLIALVSRGFSYDAENRVTATTQPNMGAIGYVYDGNGRRVQKSATTSSGTTAVTTFIYDGAGNLAVEGGANGHGHRIPAGGCVGKHPVGAGFGGGADPFPSRRTKCL